MEKLYHIHRYNDISNLKAIGDILTIDNNYNSMFYKKLLTEEETLVKRYNNYDIDYIICMMEEVKEKYTLSKEQLENLNKLLKNYYFLRREKALEEGRKIFNFSAPSRLHSLFLTDENDLNYWKTIFKDYSYKIFLLELYGNLFVSSDELFPDNNLPFDLQIEKSKEYWKPDIRKYTLKKEFVFQGTYKILNIK